MLRQVSQLDQRTFSFPEKRPETTVFLGKKKSRYFEYGTYRGYYLLFLR